ERHRFLDRVLTIGDLRLRRRELPAPRSHDPLTSVVLTGGDPPSHRETYPTTSSPIDRAVPATVLTAASSDSQLRSGSFSLAISSTCLAVTVPTLFLFGSADPFAMFAARLSSTGAGGVLVMKLYERSA